MRAALRGALALGVLLSADVRAAPPAARYADVVAGVVVDPRTDSGSHPAFRTEWWYVTGWLEDEAHRPLGFQVTFFRTRPQLDDANPSAFAAHQILIAHAALISGDATPAWHAQRLSRAGFGLAAASERAMQVQIDDWQLEERAGGGSVARVADGEDGFELEFVPGGPPLVNGRDGYSQKGPQPGSASYYYSVPQLKVRGVVRRAGVRRAVTGRAWLDHEWSSAYLDPQARGWDWVGLNLADGGALMAFRIRDGHGASRWAGGSYRDAAGAVHHYAPDEVVFRPGRVWRSARTGTSYPVEWTLRAGALELALTPLADDQEADTRQSTGAVYWEGAVTARQGGAVAGHGFLELTGYGEALKLP